MISAPAAGNRVLALLLALGLLSALTLPFLSVAPNRLVSGTGVALGALLHGAGGWVLLPVAVLAWAAFVAQRPHLAAFVSVACAVAAAVFLAALLGLAGQTAALQAGEGDTLVRVSFGGAFWILALLAWLAAADALRRLGLPPRPRALAHAAVWLPCLALLASGSLDALSLLKEYANRSDAFQAAAAQHLRIVAGTLLPALAIGVPLGVVAARHPRLARPLFAVLNVIQTVPSIALFGLLIAPLVSLAALLPGSGIQGIGLWPAVIALTLYALLPIVHSTAAGLRQVPAAAVEAATGMGMTRSQRFWRVEVPLALPLLWSGLRLTTVQVIGLAVVAALIGAGGFGAIVFQGLLSSALDLVLLGVLPVVALALVVDAGFETVAGLLARRAR
ncbi:MAG: ABC transporter permease [Burkholderiaceae bacterium]